ncbi:hypothetical protein [Streptomyces sedi]|uniref:DUF2550 family protein n=1 Tax=Streptomyces sedi TaxID=555059 RepID=A0A5C4VEH6_9ACTN|nr:hypothetical protein [Streptomyces sedi]TNM34242.1 hypothetical protein FH715_00650 [Streptomyces sedi]
MSNSDDADVPVAVPVLASMGAWAVLYGLPVLLPHALRARRLRRRLTAAANASPAYAQTLPGFAEEAAGRVSYGDGRLRLLTAEGTAWEVPFASIHVVEELPPKGLFGLPGIDVLTHGGTWTEIRAVSNQELLSTLEQAGTPVLRAVNRM